MYLAEDAAKQRQMRQLPGVGISSVAPSQVTLTIDTEILNKIWKYLSVLFNFSIIMKFAP